MEAGPSLNLERVALVHGGLRHGIWTSQHPFFASSAPHSQGKLTLAAGASGARSTAGGGNFAATWSLAATCTGGTCNHGAWRWHVTFQSKVQISLQMNQIMVILYIYIYVICYYNGEKDDKLINHYCIVCRLCMMLHTHMWNKGKRAARVDVVRERESWRGETVWVIEFHLTFIVTNIFVGVVLHGFAGVTWKHKFHAQCYCILLHTEVFPGKMHHELM